MRWIRSKIRNYLLRNLFFAVIPEDIIQIDSATHTVFLDGNKLEEREIKQLQEEIKFLTRSWIWRIFQNTLRHQAEKIMFDKSKTYDDMISGKMMLYNLDVQNNIIKKLSP